MSKKLKAVEAAKPSRRSIVEIQQDYQNLCLKAGHAQYQVYVNQKELDMVNGQLRDLNLEAAATKAADDKEKAEASVKSVEEQEVKKEESK